MKKTLLTLLGILGFNVLGFSQENNFIQERILQRIDKDKKFEKEYFTEYSVGSVASENNGEYILTYYNFNQKNLNDKVDLIACFRLGNSCAEVVMIDKNEDGVYETTYIDNNKDNIFDEKVIDIKDTKFEYILEEEVENLKKESQKNEEDIEKERFLEGYKKYLERYNLK